MTVSEAESARGFRTGEQEAKAVQQKAKVRCDQVDRSAAPEIGVSVAHFAQVVLEHQHISLPEALELYIGGRRQRNV